MSKLALEINNYSYTGFEMVNILKNMNSLSGGFALTISRDLEGIDDIRNGDSAVLKIDEKKVLTGWIDGVPVRYGKDYNWIDFVGRDKTCDLNDCSFDFTPNEWRKQTVENIIKNLCKPFSIDITVDPYVIAEVSSIVDTYKANEGQFVSDSIMEICRDNSILPLCYEDGKLTLTKATIDRYMFDGVESGKNIDSAHLKQSNVKRFDSYTVKGQGIGNDFKSTSDFVSPSGSFSDTVVSRTRPCVIFSELPTSIGLCQKRAKWEARVRAGLSRLVEYQVPNWTQGDGSLWEINSLVRVDDSDLKINKMMLILGVNFLYSSKIGEVTRLSLVDKDTFNISDSQITIKTSWDE